MQEKALTRCLTQVQGLRWSYHAGARLSDKPALVMIHGLSVSSRYMLPTARILAKHYSVYVPDLPGFGKSQPSPHVFTLPELADALVAWMQAIEVDRATLLGNSLGCQVIAQVVERHPAYVERAIFVGPTMDVQALTAHQEIGRWLVNFLCEPPSLVPIVIQDYMHAGMRRTAKTLRYGLDDRLDTHLPHMNVPTLVVRGSRDTIVPQRWAEQVVSQLPNGRLVVIRGAAHDVNYNSPKQLAACVQEFMGMASDETSLAMDRAHCNGDITRE